jgi:hypothetical protein
VPDPALAADRFDFVPESEEGLSVFHLPLENFAAAGLDR